MERESKGKISYDHIIDIALLLRTHRRVEVDVSGDSCARINLGRRIPAILLRIQSGSTCGNTEILGDEVFPKKCLEKN